MLTGHSVTAPNALNNLKAKFRAVFKKKDEKKAESKPAEASKPADATPAAAAAAATEPAKTETAPAGKSNQANNPTTPAVN